MSRHSRPRAYTEKEFRESINHAFEKVDVDRSQCLSRMEFEDVMKRVTFLMGSADCTEEDIDYLISRLDCNGDTTVSKEEFKRLVNIIVKIAFPANDPKLKQMNVLWDQFDKIKNWNLMNLWLINIYLFNNKIFFWSLFDTIIHYINMQFQKKYKVSSE